MVATLQGPFGPIVLNMPTLTIGYAPDNQLVINDTSASSHHALIRMDGQHAIIMDLGSINGTYVNEQRLEQNSPRMLNTDDRIRIGNTTFRYEEQTAPPPAPFFPETPNRESNPGIQLDAQGKPFGYTDYGQQQGNQPPPVSTYPSPYNLSPPNPYDPTWISGGHTPPPPNQLPYAGPPRPSPAQKNNRLKILLIAIAVLVVLGVTGGGITVYLLTRPQPFISVNSQYQANMIPAGSTSTDFRVSGHKFSSNSSITFLLDNNIVAGNSAAQSDKDGNVTTTLTATKEWPLGDHMLTAKDASGYTTKDGVALKIVPQGQAHTPGPDGAPPDDMNFTIDATYFVQQAVQVHLQISGHPDPNGGSVCTTRDDGSQRTESGQDNIGSYTDTYTFTCAGTYKGGKLSFTETLKNDKFTYTNGTVCTEHAPFVWTHLEGTFSNATNISGSYSSEGQNYDCTQGASLSYSAQQGTWTGQVKQ